MNLKKWEAPTNRFFSIERGEQDIYSQAKVWEKNIIKKHSRSYNFNQASPKRTSSSNSSCLYIGVELKENQKCLQLVFQYRKVKKAGYVFVSRPLFKNNFLLKHSSISFLSTKSKRTSSSNSSCLYIGVELKESQKCLQLVFQYRKVKKLDTYLFLGQYLGMKCLEKHSSL